MNQRFLFIDTLTLMVALTLTLFREFCHVSVAFLGFGPGDLAAAVSCIFRLVGVSFTRLGAETLC
jgi:hypothetical protein